MRRLFCVISALALAGVAWAGEWHVETLDFCGDLGCDVSLAVDSADHPHIAYHDAEINELKHAWWDGDEWLVETVSDCGMNTSLALDSADRPHIAYFGGDYPDHYLMYAWWDGDEWLVETVTSTDYLFYVSLALDSDDRPHIAYHDLSEPEILQYAHWDGAQWLVETVDSEEGTGLYCSIAIDSSDRPHISYIRWDYPFEYLKYARWDGDEWRIQTVDPAYYGETSLALDSSDRPVIAYTGEEWDFYQKCAWWDGDEWGIDEVESDAGCSSMVLDDDDNPHISYLWVPSDVRYARWHGSGWWINTFDTVPELGDELDAYLTQTSLALDSSGLPHIAYQYEVWDLEGGFPIYYVVKYAWYSSGPGVEGAEVFANVGDEGILVGWGITGDAPVGLTVLRSASDGEPVYISGALPGSAVRWLDRGAYDASGKGLKPLVYWLETTDGDGVISRFGPSEAVTFPGSARELDLAVYPSPAADALTVAVTLPEAGRVAVALYDLSGRRVATVYDGQTAAGRHEVSCDVSALSPGVYLARLESDAGTLIRRVVITR
jgi:hypothetical protein